MSPVAKIKALDRCQPLIMSNPGGGGSQYLLHNTQVSQQQVELVSFGASLNEVYGCVDACSCQLRDGLSIKVMI